MSEATEQRRPQYSDILAAAKRISDQVKEPPVAGNPDLNRIIGCDLWCKCENLQDTGSFKLRGATNAILHLREKGTGDDVATHSSGNHGAALAFAASLDNRKSFIVMPRNAVPAKVEAVKTFGGEVIFCEPNQPSREAGLARLVEKGFIPIPPYDHPDIIAGQGTAALELLKVKSNLDILMTPVGGGGLLSGSSIIARHMHPGITIIGAEPIGAADAAESFLQGERVSSWQPDTIADGLRALIGEMTFPIILELANDIVTVSEEGLIQGMELIFEHMGMVIEPSSATVIGAILEHPGLFAGKQVGVILSGGNIDINRFPRFAAQSND